MNDVPRAAVVVVCRKHLQNFGQTFHAGEMVRRIPAWEVLEWFGWEPVPPAEAVDALETAFLARHTRQLFGF